MKPKVVIKKQGKTQQPSAPAKKPEPQPKGKGTSFVQVFGGKKVVLQARTGTIYEGTFKEYRDGAFWLEDVLIKGTNFEARVEQLAVDRAIFAHLHTFPTELKEKP